MDRYNYITYYKTGVLINTTGLYTFSGVASDYYEWFGWYTDSVEYAYIGGVKISMNNNQYVKINANTTVNFGFNAKNIYQAQARTGTWQIYKKTMCYDSSTSTPYIN